MVSDHEKYSSDLLINLSYRVVCIQITCDIIAIASSSRINLYEMDTLLSSKEKS